MQNADWTEKTGTLQRKKSIDIFESMYRNEKSNGDIEIEKQKFHQHKIHISITNTDINKIVIPNKFSFVKKGFKYFIGYKGAQGRPKERKKEII